MSRKRFRPASRLSLWFCLLTVAPGSALFSGCGRSGREAIEGTVTLDGKPLEKGYITFRPQSGTASPSAGRQHYGRQVFGRAGGRIAARQVPRRDYRFAHHR